MRILHLYKDYHPVVGGIENHLKDLAETQVAAGHQVTVLVTNPGPERPEEILHGVRVVRVPRLATIASTPISLVFPIALGREVADIVHLHFPYPVAEVSQLLAGGKRPWVLTYHSDVVRQRRIVALYRPLLWQALRRAARILATSPNHLASSPYLKQLADNCTVVPLGINPQPFAAAEPLLPLSGPPRLLFVGRHRYYKGVDDLLRAMTQIDAELLLAGDGPMQPVWQELAAALGVASRVKFLGHVGDQELPGIYASADLFVLPANVRAEAFGTVLVEAMASGLACVTTELGTGTSYVVQHGATGLVVPPKEPAALAEAINCLLKDADLRRRMGQTGRQRALAEFTLERMAEQVEWIYQEVLEEAQPKR
ncbi:MAG: glycosyltransferase [Chloroflexi bacterium]|nr:glycosyltransferase [Chloroflexota bacterium]MCI0574649.1 glycosyltransferase [Chloroflexota bacterium]MCI0649069.1 glycosyltransferase [Chloroflexota bacterium]MCI0730524.1 glycosyltransferase [Chloroflexota bacterium]